MNALALRAPALAEPCTRLRIVVVDDVAEIRDLLRIRLTRMDFDVVGEASDGREALSRCEELQPDVVILDVSMPGMDGLDALPQIKIASPRTRVVIHSALASPSTVQMARGLGADAFAVKGDVRHSLCAALEGVSSFSG